MSVIAVISDRSLITSKITVGTKGPSFGYFSGSFGKISVKQCWLHADGSKTVLNRFYFNEDSYGNTRLNIGPSKFDGIYPRWIDNQEVEVVFKLPSGDKSTKITWSGSLYIITEDKDQPGPLKEIYDEVKALNGGSFEFQIFPNKTVEILEIIANGKDQAKMEVNGIEVFSKV
ncbi:TPA: hypothetical protein ACX6NV_000601 [Photobacterium damselae]